MRRELSATFFVSTAVLICSFLLRAQTRPSAYNGARPAIPPPSLLVDYHQSGSAHDQGPIAHPLRIRLGFVHVQRAKLKTDSHRRRP